MIKPPKKNMKVQSEEIDRHTDSYAYYATDKIETIRKSCPDAVVMVEQRLDFSNYVEDGFGTGDLVIVADDVIQVIDFKYGKGVAVSAEHNPQMMLYALGALTLYDYLYDIKMVKMAYRICMSWWYSSYFLCTLLNFNWHKFFYFIYH